MTDVGNLHDLAGAVLSNVAKVIIGKEQAVKICLAAMLSEGHILIEYNPGWGKQPWSKP